MGPGRPCVRVGDSRQGSRLRGTGLGAPAGQQGRRTGDQFCSNAAR
ncbi:hypothetical protein FM110_09425 [Brachybacterium nesterenkovii]|uniref:Uncharacterized protein n=1 Tax=Brachybacterium nesterenkovii TaxID=47847 RepID=A0A1X6X371_9MICO|nr:hypothetical protein FM110_09425 [Brachybacterium nesterenkovii]